MELVSLICSDGDIFKLEIEMAEKMKTIENLIKDSGTESLIPLKDVSGKIFKKIVEYLSYHFTNEHKLEKVEIEKWDEEFFKMEDEELFSIILTTNYIEYPELLDACCKKVASEIRGKTPNEIRKRYNINN